MLLASRRLPSPCWFVTLPPRHPQELLQDQGRWRTGRFSEPGGITSWQRWLTKKGHGWKTALFCHLPAADVVTLGTNISNNGVTSPALNMAVTRHSSSPALQPTRGIAARYSRHQSPARDPWFLFLLYHHSPISHPPTPRQDKIFPPCRGRREAWGWFYFLFFSNCHWAQDEASPCKHAAILLQAPSATVAQSLGTAEILGLPLDYLKCPWNYWVRRKGGGQEVAKQQTDNKP